MTRTLWCRWEGCSGVSLVTGTEFPATCKDCGNDARWTLDPLARKERKHAKRPRVPYDLNLMDRKFLRSVRIAED